MQSEDKDKCDLRGMLCVQFPELDKWKITYNVEHAQNYFEVDIPDVSIGDSQFWYGWDRPVRERNDKEEYINSKLDDEIKQKLGIALEENKCRMFITSNNEEIIIVRVKQQFVGWFNNDRRRLFIKLNLTNEEVRNILFIMQGGCKYLRFDLQLKQTYFTAHAGNVSTVITALDCLPFCAGWA